MTMERIQDYQIRDFIAPGGTSAVFAALRCNPAIKTPWRVAVKIVWDIGLARHEAENLVALNDSRGVVNLMDYFELPYRVIAPYLAQMPAQAGSTYTATTVERDFELKDETVVGCLVLQFLAGTPLVRQTIAVDEQEEQEYDDAISVKDLESGVWLKQTLAFHMDLEQRLDFLIQLADYIEDCHRNKIVHGDLKPQNILYNTDNQKVTILDFGGSTEITRGSPGWQAPEHFKFVLGELPELPLSTDVFLLGLFIHRFLASAKIEDVPNLVEQCLTESDKRISAGDLKRELQALQKRLFAPKRRVLSGAALAIILVLVGVIIYQFTRPPEEVDPLVKKYGHDDGASLVKRAFEIDEAEDYHDFYDELIGYYKSKTAWESLKDSVALALATARLRVFPGEDEIEFDFSEIYLYQFVNGVPYFHNRDYAISIGRHIGNGYFLVASEMEMSGFHSYSLTFMDKEKNKKTISISPFSFVIEMKGKNHLIFKDMYAKELMLQIFQGKKEALRIDYTDKVPISGFIYYDSQEEAVNKVLRFFEWEKEGSTYIIREPRYAEIYFAYYSYVSYSQGRTYNNIIEFLDPLFSVLIRDPHNYLDGLAMEYSLTGEKVYWQDFLNRALSTVCLTTTLENNIVTIQPLNNDSLAFGPNEGPND